MRCDSDSKFGKTYCCTKECIVANRAVENVIIQFFKNSSFEMEIEIPNPPPQMVPFSTPITVHNPVREEDVSNAQM
jgi:hypothetical protein